MRVVRVLEQQREKPMYAFVDLPGQGSFSFVLEYDVQVLANRGLVREQDGMFVVSERETIVRHLPFPSGMDRLAAAIEEGVLAVDNVRPESRSIEAESRQPTLFSVGYEKRSLDEFLALLLSEGVEVLVDVRKNPLSRKFGFSKRRLKEACARAGIAYRHEPALGIPSEERKNLDGPDDYRELFDRYEKTILPRQLPLVEALAGALAEKRQRLALMCMERRHEACHRSRLISKVQALAGQSVTLKKL